CVIFYTIIKKFEVDLIYITGGLG
ncbi:uncharacterized protein METZ01_LOCUS326392, partial [marine metagenome]